MNSDSNQVLTMGELLWQQAEQNSEDFAIALSLAESYGSYSDTLIQDFAIAINEELRRKLKEKQEHGFLQGFSVKNNVIIRAQELKNETDVVGIHYEDEISVIVTSWSAAMSQCYWGCWIYGNLRDNYSFAEAQAELSTQFGGKEGGGTCAWTSWPTDNDAINWKAPRALERMAKAIRRQGADKDTAFLDIFVDTLITVALIAEKHIKK